MGKIYDEASNVEAENGVVYIDGPDGVAVAVTPDAAMEIADRLIAKGAEANGQRVMDDWEARDQAKRHPK